ncbi:MAG: hypothetical protein IJJ41_04740 [Clostridia bacterium]|nr:hypothetical protein [Clostridia bacterium]
MMNYQKILAIIAKENGLTPKEVEFEMQQAIIAAGYLMSPRALIAMCCAQINEKQSAKR